MTTLPEDGGAVGVRVRTRATVRTGRYAMAGAEPAAASRIWFALHGYGQLATRFLRPFEGLIPADTCVVAPEGLSRFYLESPRADGSHMQRIGATWLTRESRDTEIEDVRLWLDRVHDEVVGESLRARGVSPSTAVLGFSQGVATAMRWVASGHVRPRCFVAWAGGLAHDVAEDDFRARLIGADTVLVAGLRDSFATEEARAKVRADFAQYHAAPREISYDGEHHLDSATLVELLTMYPRHG